MCKLGDIIVVKNYIGNDGENVGRHSFIVINDEKGTIIGLDYDIVAVVISSFKNKKQKKKKLSYDGNFELDNNSMNEITLKKESYVKIDKLFYFNKKKTEYYILATLKPEILEKLLKAILLLHNANKIEQIIDNL